MDMLPRRRRKKKKPSTFPINYTRSKKYFFFMLCLCENLLTDMSNDLFWETYR